MRTPKQDPPIFGNSQIETRAASKHTGLPSAPRSPERPSALAAAVPEDDAYYIGLHDYQHHVGRCQNYGPFLGPEYNTAPGIWVTKKGPYF